MANDGPGAGSAAFCLWRRCVGVYDPVASRKGSKGMNAFRRRCMTVPVELIDEGLARVPVNRVCLSPGAGFGSETEF